MLLYDLHDACMRNAVELKEEAVGWDGSKPLAPAETVTPELAEQAVASVKSSN